jgi:hypothetical protein
VLAVDMSNFTDPLSPAAMQGLMAAGIGHVIAAIDRRRSSRRTGADPGLSDGA